MNTGGLSLDQAPPLSVPVSFFLLAPLAILAAGVMLLSSGASLLVTRHAGATAGLTHVGTLGLLGSVMLGALYQMIPVVAGAPVPAVRSAHGVHACYAGGVVALVAGLLSGSRWLTIVGAAFLTLALVAFVSAVSVALLRAPAKTETTRGMTIAVLGLCVLLALGATMAYVRGAGIATPWYPRFVLAHVGVGLVVWVGGLISAVSFQVIPMFYLTPGLSSGVQRALIALIFSTLLALPLALALGAGPKVMAALMLPGGAAVWLLHPLAVLRALRRRRRKRADPSLAFWKLGLSAALASFAVGASAAIWDDPRLGLGFGFLVVWGWAGSIVHGMLSRIVPFLVWFHRFSSLVGIVDVPPMRRLLPDRLSQLGLSCHLLSLVLGLSAITASSDVLARLTGIGLIATGCSLGAALFKVLSHRVPSVRSGGQDAAQA